MAEQHGRNIPLNVVLGLSAVVVLAGGATAWWTLQSPRSPLSETQGSNQPITQPETSTGTQETSGQANPNSTGESDASTSAAEQSVEVYWLAIAADGGQIKLAANPTAIQPSTDSPENVIKASLQQLLAGPKESTLTTTIPKGTELQSLRVQEDGIHVDLSQEFTRGGGSASMQGRLAQVLYTATSQDPNARVWLSINGKPLEVLGGEGLILDQPLTRQGFQKDFTL